MPEFEIAQFPRLASDGKTLLSTLGQFVPDREAPQMSADERKRITQATNATLLMIMGLFPRRM
jgi:hypothetical protein